MIIFLINLVCWAITTLLNLLTWLIFSASAHLLVLVIHAFKLPGQAIQGVLEQLGNGILAGLEYLLKMAMQATTSSVSSLFDALKERIADSAAGTGSALGGLMEDLRTSLDSLIKELAPQVLESFTGLITNVVINVWKNYKDSVAYVIEHM